MAEDLSSSERRVWNRLTTIKLAIQMLDRTTALTASQRRLVRTAIEAIDGLIAELLEQRRAGRGRQAGPPAAGARELSGLGRLRRDLTRLPVAALAVLMGVILLLLIVMGAALLVQILWAVLLVGLLIWSRRLRH